MKKIVIAMLLILPLIIVASVMVATSVISNEAYIAVEYVKLNVDTSSTMEIGLSKESFQFNATVYPTGAKNKNVIWTLENVLGFGDEMAEPVTIDQTGLVRFYTYCTFDVVVTTVEGNKTTRLNVYVQCDTLDGVSVGLNGLTELKTGESHKLKPVFSPLDAEVSEVAWSSSAPNIIDVDRNGIVTAYAPGSADITVTAREFKATATITAVPGATRFGTEFFMSAESFVVADLNPSGEVTAASGGSIADGVFTFDSDEAVLNVGTERVVIKRCDVDDIAVRNGNILASELLYIGKLPMYLDAVYKDAYRLDKPTVSYSSNLPGAANPDANGVVVPTDKGAVTLTVKTANAEDSITIEVVRPVSYVRLNTVDNDDKRGIAAEALYGTHSYDDSGATVGYGIPVSIQYPVDADFSDFDLTVSDSDFAQINGNVITVTSAVTERKTLTVSVTAHHSVFESMPARANRNFTFVDGINCYDYEDVVKAATEGKVIVLQNNVVAEGENVTVEIRNDLYGNAYMIDGIATQKDSETPIIKVVGSDVTVSNAHIRCDDIIKINEANGMKGAALWVGDAESPEMLKNVTVEYCILENAYYALAAIRTEISVVGTVMRNTSNFGMHIINDINSAGEFVYSDVTMTDCIMSNIVATAVGISTQASMSDGSPLEVQSSFTQKGFLDIYNWQQITAMRMLDRDLIPGNPAANNTIKNLANKMIAAEIKKDLYAPLRVEIENEVFVNLGIVTAGALHYCTTVPTFEDQRFISFPITILDSLSSITKPFGFVLQPCILYLYTNESNITPESEFSENAETYRRLRGDK